MNWLRRHSQILSILLIASLLGILCWQFVHAWRKLPPGFFLHLNYLLLLLSLAALVPALLFVSLRWSLTLRAMNVQVEWWTSIRIWFLSQAGRYLPGGVWSYVGRFYLGRTEMAQETVIASMILETGLRVISELLVFLFSLPFWVRIDFIGAKVILLPLGGIGLGLFLLQPPLLEKFSRLKTLQKIGLRPLDLSGLRYRTMLTLLAYYILTVLMVGGAFYLLVATFCPISIRLLPALTGSFAISMVIGFLVPFVPGGWGVREGILAFLLSRMMPSSVAIVISIVARIWLSLGEMVWILGMVCLQRGSEPK